MGILPDWLTQSGQYRTMANLVILACRLFVFPDCPIGWCNPYYRLQFTDWFTDSSHWPGATPLSKCACQNLGTRPGARRLRVAITRKERFTAENALRIGEMTSTSRSPVSSCITWTAHATVQCSESEAPRLQSLRQGRHQHHHARTQMGTSPDASRSWRKRFCGS